MKYLFLLMMTALVLSSCSETDEDDGTAKYANWQERNDKAFADTLDYAKQQGEANGWKVIRNWSLNNQTSIPYANGNKELTYNNQDYIVVHVLESGEGSESPIYTDSVKVSYRGRLLNTSDDKDDGEVFDQNFEGNYSKFTAQLSKFAVKGLIDGFITALFNMHVGDRWMVYIPYQLGYDSSTSNSSIPAYSMLRFEIALDSYWHVGESMPDSRAALGK